MPNAQPRLNIFYRSTGGENTKGRPPFYSKLLCLQSFLSAYRHVRDQATLTFVNDGPMPEERVEFMRQWGTVAPLPGLGNSPSYRETLRMATALPDGQLIYFAEDDYLYRQEALVKLIAAFSEIAEADYVTLYDHLDRYRRHDDSRRGFSRLYLAGGHHWRTVESTCMTYGARTERLKSDSWIQRICTTPNTPRDRTLWRMTQGQKFFFWKLPKRTLLGPVPSLATHMDLHGMAPNVDWEHIARDVAAEWGHT